MRLASERAVCPGCGEWKTKSTNPQGVPDGERWSVKRRLKSGAPEFYPICTLCRRAQQRDAQARKRAKGPDPLGPDPLLPIAPFREWMERVVDRYDRLYGCDPSRPVARVAGGREAIAAKLDAELGGSPDRWSRMVYRVLFEQKNIRLSLADRVLLTLDFDGTTLDDLWPVNDERQAA